MEPRRRNPLRHYPTAVCISVLHFGLTRPETRALNSPDRQPPIPITIGQNIRETNGRTPRTARTGN